MDLRWSSEQNENSEYYQEIQEILYKHKTLCIDAELKSTTKFKIVPKPLTEAV